MKVIIIEDEKLSAEHLSTMLKKIDADIEVILYLDTVKGAVSALKNGITADLMFLDIHLADGNSFEIFDQVEIKIPIIFTTAYDNYAILAFKQNSIDYLLKPISKADLQFALDKFKSQEQKMNQQLIDSFTKTYQQLHKTYKNRFLVKTGSQIDTIQADEIHHFETLESLSFIITMKGNRYNIDYTMDELESMLKPVDFFRINRKIIINIQSIEKVNTYFNSRLVITAKYMDNDSKIVSRERVGDFKLWLDS